VIITEGAIATETIFEALSVYSVEDIKNQCKKFRAFVKPMLERYSTKKLKVR